MSEKITPKRLLEIREMMRVDPDIDSSIFFELLNHAEATVDTSNELREENQKLELKWQKYFDELASATAENVRLKTQLAIILNANKEFATEVQRLKEDRDSLDRACNDWFKKCHALTQERDRFKKLLDEANALRFDHS